jgi:predicted amidohydrolase
MIIDPMGEILYHKVHDEDIFTISLQKKTIDEIRAKLPFLKDADPFMLLDPDWAVHGDGDGQ